MDELDFQTLSTDNYYVNPAGIHSCFPMKKNHQMNRVTLTMI